MSTATHLTIEEASDVLRVKKTKLYQLIGSGDITAVKLGRRTLITAESASKFMASLPLVSARTR